MYSKYLRVLFLMYKKANKVTGKVLEFDKKRYSTGTILTTNSIDTK